MFFTHPTADAPDTSPSNGAGRAEGWDAIYQSGTAAGNAPEPFIEVWRIFTEYGVARLAGLRHLAAVCWAG